jgi:hypothetical protein
MMKRLSDAATKRPRVGISSPWVAPSLRRFVAESKDVHAAFEVGEAGTITGVGEQIEHEDPLGPALPDREADEA